MVSGTEAKEYTVDIPKRINTKDSGKQIRRILDNY